MKVIGIMTVRDEEDILLESATAAIKAYDVILSVDCGSEDNTPQILKDLAHQYKNFKFFGSIAPMTPMQVKRHIWSAHRKSFSHRDWWVFADADEFLNVEQVRPRLMHASKILADHVNGEHVNYYYTNADHEKWLAGEENLQSRSLSITKRRRYYRYHTQQIRFFHNLPWLRWNVDSEFPSNLSNLSDRNIQFRHYQYRDVPQIERRISIRRGEIHRTHGSNTHWMKDHLSEAISDVNDPALHLDVGRGYIKDPNLKSIARQNPLKTLAKYARSSIKGCLTAQVEENWFSALDT
ncbi:glycosyltransferase family 2 protein [Roseitranquillus sediminis]|uniref:glycosyltransferase family 2 protein n=1 Tax=Roseitranquillus sediminis TaxID=2809051 RepID=UPI001D0C421B|nr:glycosyltransferase family 2 protein [Roseitranquillus sediminis]MBM9594011.1 glycosyltransferase family 2 protein [Roseitranquillus sediminis]